MLTIGLHLKDLKFQAIKYQLKFSTFDLIGLRHHADKYWSKSSQ